MSRHKIKKLGIIFIVSFFFGGVLFTIPSKAEDGFHCKKEFSKIIVLEENTLYFLNNPETPEKSYLKIPAIVTAYSSTLEQTDENPYITASGKMVNDGIVANNFLPFGTKIRIPELFGEKIFVVEDRMHWRKDKFHFDVWFENYWDALNFGTKKTFVEVIE